MVFDASIQIAMKAIEDFNHRTDPDVEPSLFAHLPDNRFGKRFADFDRTARQTPMSLQGFVRALDQHDPIAIDDHRADAYDGAIGKLPQILISEATVLIRGKAARLDLPRSAPDVDAA